MKRIELKKTKNVSTKDEFSLKLTLDAGRAGEIEFYSSYPCAMTRREAEARLFRLSEIYGFDREDFPCS